MKKFLSFLCMLSFALAMALGFSSHALGTAFQFSGTYTGQINNVPILADAVGSLDTAGTSVNNIEITFQSIPISLHPFVLGLSWNTSRCLMAVEPVLQPLCNALNLFDLSDGNYIASRSVSWPSLPGDAIQVLTEESTSGNVMTYTAEVTGTYNGPTDIVGVSDYSFLMTQLEATTIEFVSIASLLRANGESFYVEMDTIYSGLSRQMPTQQRGELRFANLSFSNNVLSFDWQGDVECVPEPASLFLMFTGLLLMTIRKFRGTALL